MLINKKSWHYKVMSFLNIAGGRDPDPKTLCGYFWQFLFSCFAITLTSAMVGWLLFGLLQMLWEVFHDHNEKTTRGAIVLGVTLGATIAFIIGYRLYLALEMKALNEPNSFTALVFTMLGAIKSKTCPLIEYKEE